MPTFYEAANSQVRWEIYHATQDLVFSVMGRLFPSTEIELPITEFEEHLTEHYEKQGDVVGDVEELVTECVAGTIQSLIEWDYLDIADDDEDDEFGPDSAFSLTESGFRRAIGQRNDFKGLEKSGEQLTENFLDSLGD